VIPTLLIYSIKRDFVVLVRLICCKMNLFDMLELIERVWSHSVGYCTGSVRFRKIKHLKGVIFDAFVAVANMKSHLRMIVVLLLLL